MKKGREWWESEEVAMNQGERRTRGGKREKVADDRDDDEG